ncbi:MAG: DUF4349 domain-containing protein, partial [Bifidobacteriaceae bacterium]|nr:DUF4349 domain-containing protein [Bifidobacteriaceae bacterium]
MRHGCALALMVVVGLMAGCSGKVADSGGIEEPDFGDEVTDWQELGESDTDVGFEAAEDPVGEPDLYPPAEPTLADPEMGSGSEPGWEPTAVDHTQVVTIGDLALRSDTPADTFERAKEIAIQVGGIVESASVHGEDPKDQSVSATMRIPSDRFSGAVDTIKTLGRVAGWQHSSTDVGADVVDLDARISGMRASITRLEVMVSEASSTEVLLDVESMLSQRQVELESLLSQRAYYADQVSLSTLNL